MTPGGQPQTTLRDLNEQIETLKRDKRYTNPAERGHQDHRAYVRQLENQRARMQPRESATAAMSRTDMAASRAQAMAVGGGSAQELTARIRQLKATAAYRDANHRDYATTKRRVRQLEDARAQASR